MANDYFVYGAIEGLVSAIAIKFGTDISATGIGTQVLTALKPALETAPMAIASYYLVILIFAIAPWIIFFFMAREEPVPTIAGFVIFFLLILLA